MKKSMPKLSLIDNSPRWDAEGLEGRLSQIASELAGDVQRIVEWPGLLKIFLDNVWPSLEKLVLEAEKLDRSTAALVKRLLEGDRLSFDERSGVRLWYESLTTFGVFSGYDYLKYDSQDSSAKSVPLDLSTSNMNRDSFLSARECFERLDRSMMAALQDLFEDEDTPDDDLESQLTSGISDDEGEVAIVGSSVARAEFDRSSYELLVPYDWDDHGLGFSFLRRLQIGVTMNEIVAEFENSLRESIEARRIEDERLKQLDAGLITIEEFIKGDEDLDDLMSDDESAEIEENFGPLLDDFAERLSQEIEEADYESQTRGKKKTDKRRK